MHIVHYSTEYPGLAAALDDPDGVAVLAFFFEVCSRIAKCLSVLVEFDALSSIRHLFFFFFF